MSSGSDLRVLMDGPKFKPHPYSDSFKVAGRGALDSGPASVQRIKGYRWLSWYLSNKPKQSYLWRQQHTQTRSHSSCNSIINMTTTDSPAFQQQRIEGMEAVAAAAEEGGEHDDGLTEAERQMRDEEISFYSSSENEHGDDNVWGLLSGVGGNIYEW